MSEPMNNTTNDKKVSFFIVIGFTSLGILIGSIAGLSSADLTLTLFGLLFAFAGGSVIAFMGKIPKSNISLAGIALCSFSLAAVIALYIGLFVKVNEILFVKPTQTISGGHESSKPTPSNNTAVQQGYRGVLRSDADQSPEEYLKDEVAFGRISLTDACKQLHEIDLKKKGPSND